MFKDLGLRTCFYDRSNFKTTFEELKNPALCQMIV